MTRSTAAALAAVLALLGMPALADDAATCETVRISDPGWTDINATNATAKFILDALGYKAQINTLSVPIGFEALKSGQGDVFLGNWMPTQQNYRDDLDAAKAVEVLNRNLEGAKLTLGVNKAGAELGVKDYADLDAHRDAFAGQILGIEAGATANKNLSDMIAADKFGLGDWELVETSEQAMLAQVQRNNQAGKPTVFLAWAPHSMNTQFEITYLSGGDEIFGPNYGGAEVYTLARTGWPEECPNAARLFKQLTFTVDAENEMMNAILNEDQSPDEAATAWLKANPDAIGPWLDGVTTLDGQPGLEAVQAKLK